MPLIRLGDYIEQSFEANTNNTYLAKDVVGMTITKEIIPTKAKVEKTDLTKFLIVKPNYFVMNPRTHGKHIGMGFNDSNKTLLISWNNITFKVREKAKLIPKYLFMILNRNEWDRWATMNSWGSSTEVFSFETLCNYEFYLPPIEIQKKYVSIYESLLNNLKVYQSKLDDLKLVCDGYIEDLRKNYPLESIFDKLIQRLEKNANMTSKDMIGIGVNGIIPPNQERTSASLKKCKVFYKGDILYSPSSFKNGVVVYNDKIEKGLITEEYRVFYVNNSSLDSQYLLMWLKRSELGRYIDFNTIDSVRNRFQFDELKIINIPIPPIEIQKDIVAIFEAYNKRKEFVEKLKNTVRNICPILIKGAMEEGSE